MNWTTVKIVCTTIIVLCIVLNIRKRGWKSYVFNLLIAIDQVANAFLGGMPDETISSRCARGRKRWYWKMLYWLLNKIDSNHCLDALANEQSHQHSPETLR